MIKFLIGGSPCTHWSIAQSKERETTASGEGWELFKNFLIAKERFKPDFFLYENNKSAAAAIKEQISVELEAPLQYINSALVSAQNRERFYCHNFGIVPQPADRRIVLQDILEENGAGVCCELAVRYAPHKESDIVVTKNSTSHIPMTFEPIADREKGECLRATYHKSGTRNFEKKITDNKGYWGVPVRIGTAENRTESTQLNSTAKTIYKVEAGQIEIKGALYPIKLPDGFYIIRKLTVTECCRLQTMPDDYCRAVSNTQAYKGLGNGWTAEVIIHLLSHALRGIPKSEEIVVLSMYDGIGTGRYCFDKLGYHNIKYYAHEIDKHAIAISMSNYPDIKQCGNAYLVRKAGWFLESNTPPTLRRAAYVTPKQLSLF